MHRRVITTSAVLSSIVEMLQEHIEEAPNAGIQDGIIAIGDALNAIAVANGGSTDKPVQLDLRSAD